MKLNEEGKIKLRKLIEKQLLNVPDGQRIHLDKELLEELLFEKIVYKKETGEFLKLLIWSGPFLRKIDLSEVSFEDVAWGLIDGERAEQYSFDEDVINKFNNDYFKRESTGSINYSYTNAKIDFNTSFEAKKIGRIVVSNCDFSGTDLSKVILNCEYDIYFENVNLSYTDFSINYLDRFKNDTITFEECKFEGNDYSGLNCDCRYFAVEGMFDGIFDGCSFKNTGLNIVNIVDILDFKDVDKPYYFADLIRKGFFDGCFVENRIVLPETHRPQCSENILDLSEDEIKKYIYSSLGADRQEKYSEFEQSFFDSIIDNIENQKKSFRK